MCVQIAIKINRIAALIARRVVHRLKCRIAGGVRDGRFSLLLVLVTPVAVASVLGLRLSVAARTVPALIAPH